MADVIDDKESEGRRESLRDPRKAPTEKEIGEDLLEEILQGQRK